MEGRRKLKFGESRLQMCQKFLRGKRFFVQQKKLFSGAKKRDFAQSLKKKKAIDSNTCHVVNMFHFTFKKVSNVNLTHFLHVEQNFIFF